MKSVMNGTICFGLVTVAAKLYSATEDLDLSSHHVHAHDGGRIRYAKVCETCNATVENRDIASQFEIDGQTAVLTADDLAQIEVSKDREIQVIEFVPAGSIDPTAYEKPYYVGPATPAAYKPYALLTEALEAAGRVAIVRFTMRSKTRLGALSVTGKGVMVVQALRWPDEVRPPVLPALDMSVLEAKRDAVTDAERQMAAQVVESMCNEWNPDRYQDTYRTELRELVMSKLGDPVEAEAPEDVSDLLSKLQASIAAKAAPVRQQPCKQSVREWARTNGYKVSDRGRVPKEVQERYNAEAMA